MLLGARLNTAQIVFNISTTSQLFIHFSWVIFNYEHFFLFPFFFSDGDEAERKSAFRTPLYLHAHRITKMNIVSGSVGSTLQADYLVIKPEIYLRGKTENPTDSSLPFCNPSQQAAKHQKALIIYVYIYINIWKTDSNSFISPPSLSAWKPIYKHTVKFLF